MIKTIKKNNRNIEPGQGNDKNLYVKAGDFNPLVDIVNGTIPSTGRISLLVGTSLTPSNSHTINSPSGSCIVTHGSTAGLATRTVTITNSYATANSIVMASINTYGGNGSPLVKEVTPGDGEIVIEIYNAHATDALSANFGLVFAILG